MGVSIQFPSHFLFFSRVFASFSLLLCILGLSTTIRLVTFSCFFLSLTRGVSGLPKEIGWLFFISFVLSLVLKCVFFSLALGEGYDGFDTFYSYLA